MKFLDDCARLQIDLEFMVFSLNFNEVLFINLSHVAECKSAFREVIPNYNIQFKIRIVLCIHV